MYDIQYCQWMQMPFTCKLSLCLSFEQRVIYNMCNVLFRIVFVMIMIESYFLKITQHSMKNLFFFYVSALLNPRSMFASTLMKHVLSIHGQSSWNIYIYILLIRFKSYKQMYNLFIIATAVWFYIQCPVFA